MLVRLIDVLKMNQINAFFTALTHAGSSNDKDLTVNAVSSLADIWLDVKNDKKNDERVRSLRIVKSRGMGHATEAQSFIITSQGIKIGDLKSKLGSLKSKIQKELTFNLNG